VCVLSNPTMIVELQFCHVSFSSFIRYSHFIMNEVDSSCNVIYLTNINFLVYVIFLYLFPMAPLISMSFLTIFFLSYTFSSVFHCLKVRNEVFFVSNMHNLCGTHIQQPRKCSQKASKQTSIKPLHPFVNSNVLHQTHHKLPCSHWFILHLHGNIRIIIMFM
jgi:hypothetical protein